jgi:hypothetical protein
MKSVKRRIYTSILACFMACIMFAMPVLAANTTSKTLAKMNAINGMTVVKNFSVTQDGTITNVKIYLNVSSGSDPFKIYLVSPEGTEYELTPSTKSGTYNTTVFNGESPKGTWYFYVENLNITYNTNQLYPTTTVTPTVTITY